MEGIKVGEEGGYRIAIVYAIWLSLFHFMLVFPDLFIYLFFFLLPALLFSLLS